MRRRPAVALLIETSNAYARGLLAGVNAYLREQTNWAVWLPEQARGAPPPGWLARWQGDGLVARVETPAIAAAVRRTKLPVVDVSAARLLPAAPWVETDDAAIARLACEHFLERGFRHLAYCGDSRFNWSTWRAKQFQRCAQEAGATYHEHRTGADAPAGGREHRRLVAWVRRLPRPVGVLCCYDIKAHELLDACRDAGAAVPEELAVLGVDNDRLLCDLCTPPLSSIVPDAQRAGYLAAELLDKLLRGQRVPASAVLVPPRGIVTRQSTDVAAIQDAEVAAAWRYIREHACEGVNVSDVLKHVGLSRRVLESRFRRAVGRTPHAEIFRLRIARAQQLLQESDLPLGQIARRTGFEHVEYLSAAFKRAVGQPPGAYRRRARLSV